MTEIRITDAVTIARTRLTKDGYLQAEAAVARTGCQDYLASEMGLAGDGIITVYRPESAVFNRDSMATYAGKPVTLGHPADPVSSANWRDHAIGEVDSDVTRDGETIRVHFTIRDQAAIDAIANGTREISMGYTTPVELRDGVAADGTPYRAVQTGPILINHLACVPRARGGASLRIGDAAAQWGASPLTTPPSNHKEDTMSDALISVVLGDKAVSVPAAQAPAIEAFKTDAARTLADAKADHDKAIAAKDAALATKDAEIDKLKASQLSDADLDKRVQARAALLADAAKVAKDVQVAGLSDADIRKAVVAARMGDKMPADASQAYIDARFQIFAEDSEGTDTVRDALRTPPAQVVSLDAAYAERNANLSNAWMDQPVKKGA